MFLDLLTRVGLLLTTYVIQSVMIAGVALLVGWLLFRRQPAARSMVLTCGILACCVCPLVSVGMQFGNLPAWGQVLLIKLPDENGHENRSNEVALVSDLEIIDPSVTELAPHTLDVASEFAGELYDGEFASMDVAAAATEQIEDTQSGIREHLFRGAIVMGLICLLGSVFLFTRLLCGCLRIRRIDRSTEAATTVLLEVSGRISRELGLQKPPPVKLSHDVNSPVALGILRPIVLIPYAIAQHSMEEELTGVLRHEFAHIIRRDPAVLVLQRVVGALFWMNPLIHLLNHHLSVAREQVCDNVVLQWMTPVQYGQLLLDLTTRSTQKIPTMAPVVGLFSKWKLESRISGLLEKERNTMTDVRRTTAVCIAGLFSLLTLAVAGNQFACADDNENPQPDIVTITDTIVTPDGKEIEVDGGEIIDLIELVEDVTNSDPDITIETFDTIEAIGANTDNDKKADRSKQDKLQKDLQKAIDSVLKKHGIDPKKGIHGEDSVYIRSVIIGPDGSVIIGPDGKAHVFGSSSDQKKANVDKARRFPHWGPRWMGPGMPPLPKDLPEDVRKQIEEAMKKRHAQPHRAWGVLPGQNFHKKSPEEMKKWFEEMKTGAMHLKRRHETDGQSKKLQQQIDELRKAQEALRRELEKQKPSRDGNR